MTPTILAPGAVLILWTLVMLVEHLRDAALDPPIGPAGYPRQLDPTRQPFPTRDGYLAIVPYTPESTARLMALLGSDGLTETPEFQAAKAKGQHMPIVYSEIARKTPAKTTAEWLALFAENDIPAMAVRDLQDIKDDPHLSATGFFQRRTHPDVGAFHEMQPPVKYGAMPPRDLGFAPRVDGDGAAIRTEIRAARRD